MSNLKYALLLEEEILVSMEGAKPHLVPRQNVQEGSMTRHVEAALDVAFANGSMPA